MSIREKTGSPEPGPASREEELTHAEVKKRAVGGIAAIFVRQGVMRVIGFVSTLVLARLLSPEIFGVFAVVQFVLTFFNQLSLNGITAALVRRKEMLTATDLGTGFLLQQMLTGVSMLLILLVAPFAVRYYHLPDEDAWLFRAVALALFFSSFKVVPTITLQRALRFERVAMADILEQIIYVTTAAIMAYFKFGVWALVAATCVRGAAGALILALMGGWGVALRFDRPIAREILRFAVPMQVVNLTTLAYQGVIPLMVGPIFGAGAVGVSSTARTLIEAFTLQPLTMISGIQLRLMARVQDDAAQLRRLMDSFIFFVGAVCFPLIAILSVFASLWIPAMLSAKWAAMAPMFQALAPAYLLRMTAVPYSQALKALGRTRIQVIATFANVAVLAGGFLLLSQWMGLSSYALATVAGDFVFMILMLLGLRDTIRVRSLTCLVGPTMATVLSLAFWMPAALSHLPSAVRAALTGAGILAYPMALIVLDGKRVAAYARLCADSLGGRSPRFAAAFHSAAQRTERFAMADRFLGRSARSAP